MSDFLDAVLKAAGVLGIVIGAFLAILKLVVPHLLEKELRRHQADLDRQIEEFKIKAQAQYEEKLDRARHELNLQAHEHSVRFTRLHQKRATVIATTYARLDELHRAVRKMVEEMTTGEEQSDDWKASHHAYEELADYWYARSIWLEPSTNDAIRPVVDMLNEPITLLRSTGGLGQSYIHELISRAWGIANDRVPAARTIMEEEMRRVLAGERPGAERLGDPTPKGG